MKNEASFKYIAGISGIVSGLLSLGSFFIAVYAVDFNFDLISRPSDMLFLGERAARLFRWAWFVNDNFGYYFLLAPVAIYLWYWLNKESPKVVTLSTFCELSAIVVGMVSSGINAAVLAPMMEAYPQLVDAQREMMELIFQTITNLSLIGMSAIALILAGLWWLGIGWTLQKERRYLGILSMLLGLATLIAAPIHIFGIEALAMLENISYLFAPIWAIWLGIVILRDAGEYAGTDAEPGGAARNSAGV